MFKKPNILFLLGSVSGAIIISIVGLAMGWVVTSGRAHATATEMSVQAVRDQLVPICMQQFRSQADSAGTLAALRDLKQWEREEFVGKHGWATMPGSESAVRGIALECAARLSVKPS